tara:strand:- start:43 stop:1620 length:1578 start_codon:yes stop_codon:yes gene_type:complete
MTLGIGSHANIRRLLKKKVHKCCDRKVVGAVESVLVNNNFTTTVLNQFNNIDTNNTEVISNTSLDDNITADVTLKIDNITLADISSEDQTKLIDDTKNYIANTLGYNINNILVYLSEGSVNINIVVFAEVEDSVFTDVDDNEYRISVLGEITESTYNGVTQNGNTLTTDNIKTAVLGKSVTSIGERAFWGSSLTEFTIPYSVTTIGDSAFAYTSGLKQFIVSSNSNHFEVIDGVLYKKNSDNTLELIQYPLAKGNTAFTIPNNVVKLLNRCFSDEKNLTSVVMPDSVTSVELFTFRATNIESIQLSNNLENLGRYMFLFCSGLTSITIPNSVTSIEYGVFYGCDSLVTVTIPNSVTSLGARMFYYCTSLTSITIPNSVTSIESGAFTGCNSLTSITIPNSVTIINSRAFQWCYNLTTVTFEENSQLKTIGHNAFNSCTSLTSVIFGENSQLETIDIFAFFNCTSLTSITIPNSVTSINDLSFLDSGLTTVNIYGSSITISGNTYNVGDYINFFGVDVVSIVQISS